MKIFKALLLSGLLLLVVGPKLVWGDCPKNACENISDLNQKVSCLEDVAKNCESQRVDLTSQIAYMDSQIKLTTSRILGTESKINQLAQEIDALSAKIDRLEQSLGDLSNILLERIVATYKQGTIEPFHLLLSSNGFSDFLTRLKYIKVVQAHDKKLMFEMQETKDNYTGQKTLREEKKREQELLRRQLESQKAVLAQQQRDKQTLLEVTRNDETRYQGLLSQARAELQALLTSKFSEKKHVNKGDVIGLMGNTGFSTGPHLHFGVYNLNESDASSFDYFSNAQDPFSYLSSNNVHFDANSCDDVSSSQNKTVGSGSWNWPMNNPTISQCFGHTPYSFVYQGNFHHGVDMYNNYEILIKAAEEGEAYFYRGTSSFGNNVRIFHSNGKMTLYLHMK